MLTKPRLFKQEKYEIPLYDSNGEMPVLMDTSAFVNIDPERVVNLLECTYTHASILDIPIDQIRRAISVLDAIKGTPGICTISQVRYELFAYKTFLLGRLDEEDGDNGAPDEREIDAMEGVRTTHRVTNNGHNLRAYAEDLVAMVDHLRSIGDPSRSFLYEQRAIFKISLNIANQVHVNREEIQRRIREGDPTVKYGDRLNTDNILIATAIAFSVYTPGIFYTIDDRLMNSFYEVEDRLAHYVRKPGKRALKKLVLGKYPMEPLHLPNVFNGLVT